MQLSDHFTLSEAEKSQTAIRNDIDNSAPSWALPRLQEVACQILEPCRAHFGRGYSPSSWWRSEALCKALVREKPGESPAALQARVQRALQSQHAKGEAVDFEIPGVSNYDLAKFISKQLSFDQLILEFYTPGSPSSGWVHCSYLNGTANRHEILWYNGGAWHQGLPNLQ